MGAGGLFLLERGDPDGDAERRELTERDGTDVRQDMLADE